MIDTERLREIQKHIEALRSQAMEIVKQAMLKGDSVTYDRAVRGWSAEIEMALSTEHQWMGSLEMDTLEETIACCETLNDSTTMFESHDDRDSEADMRDEDWN